MKKLFILLVMCANFLFAEACYQIKNSSDREACLGNAYSTDNQDARNIILGNCYSLSNRANDNGLREVCVNGKSGCYSLKDSNVVSKCVSCNGSNKWARTFAVGYTLNCY